jgi:cell division septum initiation protein DivIVA
MNENSDFLPNLAAAPDEDFEVQLRGYSRKQVDDFVARCRSQARENEERLNRALDETERLRQEVKAVRQQALGNRPAHEEVSERISQILKLADDEAHAQKSRADEDIRKQRSDAQAEADRVRKEARDQAEQMLTAAQEQAERAISTARADADKTRNTARAEADHTTADARKKADSVLSTAKAQAKQTLDEATARATAIHDGAERRLNLLSTRHAETIRRLTEILDGVSGLVASETARLSLEDEVEQTVAKALGQPAPADGAAPAAPGQDGAPMSAGSQRPAPANSAPAGPPQGAPLTGQGRPLPAPPAPPAAQPSKPAPGTAPLPAGRGAHEAPRGRQPAPPAPNSPASAPPLPGDRATGPNGTAEQPRVSAEPQAASRPGEDPAGNRQPNGPGARRAPASFSDSIDPEESTEGVRIVREQRQR